MSKETKKPKEVDWQKRIVSERMIKFDHKLADLYLCMPAFQEIERDINNEHVEHLSLATANGSFLVQQATVGSRSNASDRKIVSGDEMFNVCVACFNAYKGGMPLSKTPPGKRTNRVVAR